MNKKQSIFLRKISENKTNYRRLKRFWNYMSHTQRSAFKNTIRSKQ
jgi:hypothetical protein